MNHVELGKYLGEDLTDFTGFFVITNIKLGSDEDISQSMSENFLLETRYHKNNQ